jgi:hypothetical protein
LEAQRLGSLILTNALIEDKIIKFSMPINSIKYEPTDLVTLNYKQYNYQIRIISIQLKDFQLYITGIFDDFESYHQPQIKHQNTQNYQIPFETKLVILDLPFIFEGEYDKPYLAIYLRSQFSQNLLACLNPEAFEPQYTKILNLNPGAVIGELVNFQQANHLKIFLIDDISIITINCRGLKESFNENGTVAMLGNEIINFRNIKEIGENLFELSNIVRGIYATEQYINSHILYEDFVVLDINLNLLNVSSKLENNQISFKLANNDLIQNLKFRNNSQKLPSVYIEKCQIIGSELQIDWKVRAREIDDWIANEVLTIYKYNIEILIAGEILNYTINDEKLKVRLNDYDLSGEIKICIIAENDKGLTSLHKSAIPINLNH